MSDGATPEEALRNGDDAMRCWIEAAEEAKRGVPPPYTKALLPVPASLHDELAARLEARGVEAERRVPEILLAGPEKLLPRDPGNQKAPASGPARRHAPVERVGQSLR